MNAGQLNFIQVFETAVCGTASQYGSTFGGQKIEFVSICKLKIQCCSCITSFNIKFSNTIIHFMLNLDPLES